MLFWVTVSLCQGQTPASPKAWAKGMPAGRGRLDLSAAGLPYDSIYSSIICGLQDRAGNIWFSAMRLGVFKYDGVSFTNYSQRDGLINNKVECIMEDKSGIIWFGTDSGVSRYDGKTFTSVLISATTVSGFYRLNTSRYNLTRWNPVRCIFQDRSGKMWFGTEEGLYGYDGKSFTHFLDTFGLQNKDGLTLKAVACMHQDKKGDIWIGSSLAASEGLIRYDGTTLTRYRPNGDGWVRNIIEDKKGNLWFSCRFHPLCKYDGKAFINMTKTEAEGLSQEGAGTVMEDKAGNIWFSTFGKGQGGKNWALWRINGSTYTNLTLTDRIVKDGVWSMLQDKAGYIWIGTRGMGLYRYDGNSYAKMTR